VVAKGSQYKVESMMLRIAKPLNFIAVSPHVQQRVRMLPPGERRTRQSVLPVVLLYALTQSRSPDTVIAG